VLKLSTECCYCFTAVGRLLFGSPNSAWKSLAYPGQDRHRQFVSIERTTEDSISVFFSTPSWGLRRAAVGCDWCKPWS